MNKSLFLVGACILLLPRFGSADDAFGTPDGSGYGTSPGSATGTNSGPPKTSEQPKTTEQPNTNTPPASIAQPIVIAPPKELLVLKSSYDSDMEAAKDSPDNIKDIQERYRDDLKQLFRKAMVKGDEGAALAIKLEMLKTRPGYPFTGNWAIRSNGGYSLMHFSPCGTWVENTNGHLTHGTWSAVNDKTVAVHYIDNGDGIWHYQFNDADAGHLLREDGLDYGSDEKVRAYVAPGADGSLRLEADDADLAGSQITLERDDPDAITNWCQQTDSAAWQVKVAKPGDYQVVFNYALDPGSKGSVVVLSGGGDQVTFTPPATTGWSDFQAESAGTIHLSAAGPTEFDLTSSQKSGDGVFNLRFIVLVPVNH
jgi:hypothetical protein